MNDFTECSVLLLLCLLDCSSQLQFIISSRTILMLNQMLNCLRKSLTERQHYLLLKAPHVSRLESSTSFSPQLASIRTPYRPWFAGAASSRWGGVKYNSWLDSCRLGIGEWFYFHMMDEEDGQRESKTSHRSSWRNSFFHDRLID